LLRAVAAGGSDDDDMLDPRLPRVDNSLADSTIGNSAASKPYGTNQHANAGVVTADVIGRLV
jgi:hypothetical protein